MNTRIQNLFIALAWLALPTLVQAQFTFTTNNGAITITGYHTAAGLNVVIPASTNGYPVTSIGTNAFYNLTTITSVTIPNSVTSIGTLAFYYCSSMTSVTIPNSVTNIGDYAFLYCSGLTNVTIPNSVTSIGDGAFSYCSNLTNVIIPNSITSIGNYAFAYCSGLTSVTIPNSVTNIGDDAFWECSGLTSVTIPNSVTSIGSSAFVNCTSLTSVTIGNNVTSIGYAAFSGCSGLTSVTIPNSVINIGTFAFSYCVGLHKAYFQGNAPTVNGSAGSADNSVFYHSGTGTNYYLPGTTGWGATFGGWPTVLWNPQATAMGVTGGQFGFTLSGPPYAIIVVEAATNLSNPVWLPVSTNTLSGLGTSAFSDPTGYPMRYYRFRSP